MKSQVFKIFLKVFATLLFIGAVFYFLIMPKLNELVDNQIKISQINFDQAAADSKLSQLKKISKNKDDLDATVSKVNEYLPDDPSASTFIVKMEQTSSQIPVIIDSLSVTEIKTKTTTKSTDASESKDSKTATTTAKKPTEKALTFSATFRSSYENILIFLKKMEEMSRFNTIESITLGSYSTEDGYLTLKADGKIYYAK